MKQYKVTREIQKFNRNANSAMDIYQTTEKSTLKVFDTLEEAKRYLSTLHKRASWKPRFESITNGSRQFRINLEDKVIIYKVV